MPTTYVKNDDGSVTETTVNVSGQTTTTIVIQHTASEFALKIANLRNQAVNSIKQADGYTAQSDAMQAVLNSNPTT
jgi:hypothetical protein